MERDVTPIHSSTAPPLDNDAELGLEDVNLGDYDSITRGSSRLQFPEPPCSLRQPCSIALQTTSTPEHLIKLPCRNGLSQEDDPVDATNSKLGADHSLPGSTVTLRGSGVIDEVIEQSCKENPSSSHAVYSPGDTSGYPASVTIPECLTGNLPSNEQTAFADFSVFIEPVSHHWCCGFTPLEGRSPWESGTESSNLAKGITEPGACGVVGKGYRICTEVQHCEHRVTTIVSQRAQGHHHCSQEPVTGIPLSEQIHRDDEEPGDSGERMHGSIHSFSSLLPETGSEPASEDFASFCDIVSPDGLLEEFGDFSELEHACRGKKELSEELLEKLELEPEEEVEEGNIEICRDADSSKGDFSDHDQSECREHSGSNPSAIDGPNHMGLADSVKLVEEGLAILKEDPFGGSRDSRQVQEAGDKGEAPGLLPPSDSFADFCSAPTEDNSLEQEREGDGSWEGSLCSRVQKLLKGSFPELPTAVRQEEVVDIPSLGALLQAPGDPAEDCGGRRSGVPPPPSVPRGLWQQPQEVHDAVGLRFQWGGSHSNRTLLRCLDIDTRNVLFSGQRKQPIIVPAFAANLGMLEPTKESLSASQAVTTAQASSASHETRDSVQEAPPLSQVNWSSGGLSNPQDAELDLDCFGRMDSGSTGSITPPGMDPDLFELTTAKVECIYDNSHLEETFNRLMSSVKGTHTFVRKPQHVQDLSEEAILVIDGLSDITFMQAKVLMFPSVLTPSDN